MSARGDAARARARANLNTFCEKDPHEFLAAVLEAPLNKAMLSDKQLAHIPGASFRMAKHRLERDRDTDATKALQSILCDYRDGKPLSAREQDIGRWLDAVCRAYVDTCMEKAEDRGDFARFERDECDAQRGERDIDETPFPPQAA